MPKYPWKRHRFKTTSAGDPRPVTFPPPGPWWCSGYAGDDSYAIVIAFLPSAVEVTEFWPEAYDDEFTEETEIVFSDRFSRPKWWQEPTPAEPGKEASQRRNKDNAN